MSDDHNDRILKLEATARLMGFDDSMVVNHLRSANAPTRWPTTLTQNIIGAFAACWALRHYFMLTNEAGFEAYTFRKQPSAAERKQQAKLYR